MVCEIYVKNGVFNIVMQEFHMVFNVILCEIPCENRNLLCFKNMLYVKLHMKKHVKRITFFTCFSHTIHILFIYFSHAAISYACEISM